MAILGTGETRVNRVSDGSFEKLVSDHSKGVLTTALRIVGDINAAQDVHHKQSDVFVLACMGGLGL